MRRLGIVLALSACTSQPPGDTGLDATTSEVSTSSSEDSGVHAVTGWDTSTTDPDVTSTTTPAHAESTSGDTGETTVDPGTSGTTDADTTGTTISKECGNGVVEGDEICDDGNQDNDDNCTVFCAPPRCGDSLAGPGEVCDDGNDQDDDACMTDCTAAYCGDGILWIGMETCDDGNAIATDACLPTCKTAKCGDSVVWVGHEVCDDGFNEGDYGGCAPGCTAKAAEYCGNGKVEPTQEHCDGPTGMAGVTCDQCLFDFSAVPQMACNASCTWGVQAGCGQDDADIFCKLRTGNASAKAKAGWKTAPPTEAGGFPCADPNVYIDLNGSDPRKWLGPLPQFGVLKNAAYQASKIKTTHGTAPVLQAADVQCDG